MESHEIRRLKCLKYAVRVAANPADALATAKLFETWITDVSHPLDQAAPGTPKVEPAKPPPKTGNRREILK